MTYEEAVALAKEALERFNAEGHEALAARLSDELRVVTRFGELRGEEAKHYIVDFWRTQTEQFDVRGEPEEWFDAGGGRLVVFVKMTRRRRPPEEGYVNAWIAQVMEFDDAGDLVFFEGYQDREKALRDTGVRRPEESAPEPRRRGWLRRR